VQAVILVGGEGTRLRPLTSLVPKPVLPLGDRPFIVHMLDWLRGHGVRDVIMACGFEPSKIRAALGDGAALGVSLRYLEEPEPRGTAGALKFAEEHLDERFLMLNGDVLTDIDLSEQIAQHEDTGARATLALAPVADPSAYGLVRLHDDRAVREFVEKPSADQIDTNLISAGAYVLERSVLDLIPPARNVSIEREVWPALVGNGLYGYAADGAYWLDIGTPETYLRGTFDLLEGKVRGDVVKPIGEGCVIADDAVLGPLVVLGPGVTVEAGATIDRAVVLAGAFIGAGAHLTDCIVASGAHIGAGTVVSDGAVVGEGVTIGAGNVLAAGVKVFPQTVLGDGAIKF
jgi:mannose-1-phosphate guanylyltransferase